MAVRRVVTKGETGEERQTGFFSLSLSPTAFSPSLSSRLTLQCHDSRPCLPATATATATAQNPVRQVGVRGRPPQPRRRAQAGEEEGCVEGHPARGHQGDRTPARAEGGHAVGQGQDADAHDGGGQVQGAGRPRLAGGGVRGGGGGGGGDGGGAGAATTPPRREEGRGGGRGGRRDGRPANSVKAQQAGGLDVRAYPAGGRAVQGWHRRGCPMGQPHTRTGGGERAWEGAGRASPKKTMKKKGRARARASASALPRWPSF